MAESVVPENVRVLADQMAEARPMRRGSVSERLVRCNRAGCPCGDDTNARHGPYFSVSRVVNGKTKSRWLNGEEAKVVRSQVEAGQEFRKNVEAYWQACEQWADAQLETPEAASQEAVKKGGSKRPSRARSSPKLKR